MRLTLRLHRWLGLTVGGMLSLSGLTGALLVFGHDLERSLAPQLLRAPPAAGASLDEAIVEVARAQPGRAVTHIRFPRTPDGTYEFWLDRSQGPRVYVDPGSGRLLGSREPEEGLVGFIRELHVHLLAGSAGEAALGAAGAIVLVLLCAGGIVWARTGGRRGARRAPASSRVHRSVGVCSLALLAVAAVTGTALAFSESVRSALNGLTGGSLATPAASIAARPRLDAALASAQAALPSGRVTWIYLPARPGAPVTVRLRTPGEHHPNGLNRVYTDPSTGALIRVDRAADAPLGVRAFEWIYPLHIGTLGGIPHRAVLAAFGFLPSLLLVTGVLTHRRRRRALPCRKNRRSNR